MASTIDPTASESNHPESLGAMDTQTHGLLAALMGFMQPIIDTYKAPPDPHGSLRGQDDIKQREGQKLLDAIDNFIAKRVRPESPVQLEVNLDEPDALGGSDAADAKADTELDAEADTKLDATLDAELQEHGEAENLSEDEMLITSLSMSVSSESTHEAIQSAIITVLRPHVFNKMPIRILTFDSTGSDMRLVERGEIFRIVLENASAGALEPNFQTAWQEAEELANSPPYGWHEARNRQNTLITELVEYHARYAILSHTWLRDTPGEVVFQDWARRTANARGYAKIARFCAVAAAQHGVAFGWMDSICINKESSSELDESIRSMYKWYRAAHVCVAFLADTRSLDDMRRDAWFTRGWTLQELLAPREIRFYNADWADMLAPPPAAGATGADDALPFPPTAPTAAELVGAIHAVTSITADELRLCQTGEGARIPLSRRLALAADREVTREEDSAYSLMGLLGVDISVAYGEGAERAFFRLLRELLATTRNVLDIFNHGYWEPSGNALMPKSLKQYKMRSSTRAPLLTDEDVSRLLSDWPCIEPIILTHLGVCVPLLLVPGLKVLSTQEISPNQEQLDTPFEARGDISGSIALYMWVDVSEGISSMVYYNLLDARIYRPDAEDGARSAPGAPRVSTFGVMNFSADSDDIILASWCFCVLLDCDRARLENILPSDRINIMASRTAPILQLKDRKGREVTRIPKGDLWRHGMKLVTLYL